MNRQSTEIFLEHETILYTTMLNTFDYTFSTQNVQYQE